MVTLAGATLVLLRLLSRLLEKTPLSMGISELVEGDSSSHLGHHEEKT